VHSMTFAQRRNRLTTHFSERIPVVKRRMTVYESTTKHCHKYKMEIIKWHCFSQWVLNKQLNIKKSKDKHATWEQAHRQKVACFGCDDTAVTSASVFSEFYVCSSGRIQKDLYKRRTKIQHQVSYFWKKYYFSV